MTHDELKDKIYWHWRYVQGQDGLQAMTDYRRALLEVVRLHKPRPSLFDDLECAECTGDEEINQSFCYPCATIKAIEKELNV